ncbi:MAG TPA: hypothetical protein VGN26_17800 [Armatimonadota bacterium]|jgi:hypothetical protein
MPKSKLRGHRGGHACDKGKGSVYQRMLSKRMEERDMEGALALSSQPLMSDDQPASPASD